MTSRSRNKKYEVSPTGFPLRAPAVDSWYTSSQFRVEAPPISMDSPPPFSRYASFRPSSTDSSSSTIRPPLSPSTKQSSSALRHPFARTPNPIPLKLASAHPQLQPRSHGIPIQGQRRGSEPDSQQRSTPLPISTQTLPAIFRRTHSTPLEHLPPPKLFHPRPLLLATRSDPVLPLPLPSPNETASSDSHLEPETSSTDSHLEPATFIIGHRETLSIGSAKMFTPPPPPPCSPPLPPPRINTGDYHHVSSPSSSSSATSSYSRGPFTPEDPFSNRIPSKATRLLGLVAPEEEELDALGTPKPSFGFGFGFAVGASGGNGAGVGMHYSCHSEGSSGSAATSTGSLVFARGKGGDRDRGSSFSPPPPSRPLPRPAEVGVVSIERGGGVIPTKAKKILGIPEQTNSFLPSNQNFVATGSVRIVGGSQRPPTSPALLSYLLDDDEDEDPVTSESNASSRSASNSSRNVTSTTTSESFFAGAPFQLQPLAPLTPPPTLQLTFPSSPTPFSSFFADFTLTNRPSTSSDAPKKRSSHFRLNPSQQQVPAYRESSLMPDDPPLSKAPSNRQKNVKGLVLQPCGGGGGKRRVLKKARKPEAPEDEETIGEDEEEMCLPLGGVPPVKLGRMSVDQPTSNMGGGRRAENAGSFFQSIPSMIIANHTSHLLQPVAYPLARSLSTRDFPTSPSNSSSADHHEPLEGGWEAVTQKPSSFPSTSSRGGAAAPPCSPAQGGLKRLDEEPESEEGGGNYSEASNGTFGGR
ncbi:hypothetical protein BDY24DRAFT_443482 [Mrakia frigida]|uniref:uncharacterized protein n=1 Tax=Mrakia frigida TaxID=29902 RepID=UPI003FCC1C8C